MHRDEIAARLTAIMAQALPRERVILKELPEGIEGEDVMVLPKEEWINLQISVAWLLERADALAMALEAVHDFKDWHEGDDTAVEWCAQCKALAAYRGAR